MTKIDLLARLVEYQIPISQWGKGNAKTVDQLLEEINKGETDLEVENGVLVRNIQTARVNVFYKEGKLLLKLKEDRQVFADGRVRRRNLDTSISEKVMGTQGVAQAMKRGLKEELGIISNIWVRGSKFEVLGPSPSVSYPGLITVNETEVFDIFLSRVQYNPAGYVSKEKDKTNYFVWQQV